MMRKFLFLFLLPFALYAQKPKTTFGFQFKPIVPVESIDDGTETISDSVAFFSSIPNYSTSFGMLIRHEFTKSLSIETGISSVRRNYTHSVSGVNHVNQTETSLKFINYQIPVQALFYVQLSKRSFMNVATGVGLDMYPTDVFIRTDDRDFTSYIFKRKSANLSILANVGFEYRTEKKGTFYVGGSFNRPFNIIGVAQLEYEYENHRTLLFRELNGSYVSLDFRYFFPENKKD